MKHMCVKIRYVFFFTTVTCCQDLELLYES